MTQGRLNQRLIGSGARVVPQSRENKDPKWKIFRDDDISVTTNIQLLMLAHQRITAAGREHHIAIQMKDLWDNKEVWFFVMTAPNLKCCLHGWDHSDYSKMSESQAQAEIQRALDYWNTIGNRGHYSVPVIDTFYPPWNRSSPALEQACAATGLTVNTVWKTPPIYPFHSWELIYEDQLAKLEAAIRA